MGVKFGIIGLGGIANRFAKVLNTADGVELTAVASREIARSEEFAKKYNSKKAYGSYQELIQDEEVEVVYVALTHNFHYEIVKQCLNNGKGVLCEKPFVTNKKAAEELAAIAGEKKLLLMEAMWTRFLPAFRKAKEWIHTGKIGEARLVNASFCFKSEFNPESRLFNPELAGGGLYDVGVYSIEFTTGILGLNPEKVTGLAAFCKSGVDDLAVINMSFKNNALAAISCGVSVTTGRDAVIYGTEGRIVVYNFYDSRKCEIYDNSNNLTECFEEEHDDGFIFQIEHFRDLFKDKKLESPIIPLEDTIACAGIFDELMKQWGKA